MKKFKDIIHHFVSSFGLPRILIALFLFLLFCIAPIGGVSITQSISDVLMRFGQNAVLVLAMVPMIHSGCGLNFGLPLGIIAGLLGGTIAIELNVVGVASFFVAIIFAVMFSVVFGLMYGTLLNRIKGGEMMIATYVGYAAVAFMCMMWLLLPYKHPQMVWGYAGRGLRTTISTEGFYYHVLSDFLKFKIFGITVPTGGILFFVLLALCIWAFLKTKTGTAMTAVGSNPIFARACGINVNRIRTLSVIMSTALGAIGILVYQQAFGFIQLYMGPFYMALPAVSAILIGGASVNKASIANVVIGTFLFQGIVTMTPSVMNSIIHTDMSEVIRIIVSNGMILYALTRKSEVSL